MTEKLEFTTADVAAGRDLKTRQSYVNRHLDVATGGVAVMRCADIDHSHHGRMVFTRTPHVVIGQISDIAVTCRRELGHIRNDGDDSLFVHFNLGGGRIGGQQFGRNYELATGQGTVSVHNASVDFTTQAGSGLLGIALPRHLVETWSIAPEDLAARIVDLDHPYLRHMRHYVGIVLDEPDEVPGLMASAAAHIAHLLGVGFGAIKPHAVESHPEAAGPGARLMAIRRYIRQYAAAGDLSAAVLGRQLGLSERTVQHTLNQAGTSFSRLCADIRAEKALYMLMDPAASHIATVEIGFLCGFNDVSAFYRAFKARYDDTPGNWRKRGQA